MILRYWRGVLYLFKDSQLFFQIYSGSSRSLCGSMSNFDGLLLLEFLPNRLQSLAQWSLRVEVLCYGTMILKSCKGVLHLFKNSQLFFQIYSGYSRSLCRSMSVQWCICRVKPIHWILDQSIEAFCYRRLHTDTLRAALHIIIKTGHSEYESIWQRNIYLFKSTKAHWGLLISEKSKIPIKNGCQKTHKQNSNQSVIIKITQHNSEWLTKNS